MLSSKATLELGSKSQHGSLWSKVALGASRQSRAGGTSTGAVAVATPAGGLPSLQRQSLSVAVIGGGAGGLVAARELMREGHSVRVYEKGPRIGGVWVYSPEVEDDPLGVTQGRRQVHGSMYANLRTNLPRMVMSFTDFPFDDQFPGSKDGRQFCSHEEVLRYLEAFAATFGLGGVVRTRTEVVAVRPLPPCAPDSAAAAAAPAPAAAAAAPAGVGPAAGSHTGRWEVVTRSLAGSDGPADPAAGAPDDAAACEGSGGGAGDTATEQFDAVVVCNGHYSEPRVPSLPGQDVFPGLQMHSHNYRTPEAFAGQTVVLLGAAPSGVDIAQELAGVGARIYLCARVWENPLTGEALETTTSAAEAQPGEIVKSANIAALRPDGAVELESGVVVPRVDTLMYCTGFHYSFPFLDATGIVSVEDNRVGPLYRHVFPPSHAPSLSFVGLTWKVVPFPLMELQCKWIARALSGRAQLPPPEEMETEVERFYADLRTAGVQTRYTHRQAGELQWQYDDWLIAQCGPDVPHLPAWRKALYAATGISRKLNGDAYRDEPLPGVAAFEEEARQEAAALWAQQAQQQEAVAR